MKTKEIHVHLPTDLVTAVRTSATNNGRTFPKELASLLRSSPALAPYLAKGVKK